jgi:cysteine synthase
MKVNSVLETIGNTPVVRINRLGPQGVNLFVKIEAFNPLGSVKDRLALGVIEAAEIAVARHGGHGDVGIVLGQVPRVTAAVA